MTHWYIQLDSGDEVGPLRPPELLEEVRQGTVTPGTLIRKDDSTWFTADSVGGLFEAAERPTIEHYCPQCRSRIPPPPTTCRHCDTHVAKAEQRVVTNVVAETRRPLHVRISRVFKRLVRRFVRRG